MTLKEFLAERRSICKAAAQYPRCEDTFTKDVEHNYETCLKIIEVQDLGLELFSRSGAYMTIGRIRAQVDELIKDKE